MNLQGKIDKCISTSSDKQWALLELGRVIGQNDAILLCDFDDTLITPGIATESYFHGYRCASMMPFTHTFIPQRVTLSSDFLNYVHPNQDIVIVTRNFTSLVKQYIEILWPDLDNHSIYIVGIVWKVPGTALDHITSADKIRIMSKNNTLLTDVFEYRALCHDMRCVFLPPPLKCHYSFLAVWHILIKIRDFFYGFISAFFGNKISKS
jgi:hypothetical protein